MGLLYKRALEASSHEISFNLVGVGAEVHDLLLDTALLAKYRAMLAKLMSGLLLPASWIKAANITVTLDGRYATRTDAQGRYEFPFVAAGTHTVTVASDSLPLPWAMQRGERTQIEVNPRDVTRLDFGATRDLVAVNGE